MKKKSCSSYLEMIRDVAAGRRMSAYLEENLGASASTDDTCGDGGAGGDALGEHIWAEDHETC